MRTLKNYIKDLILEIQGIRTSGDTPVTLEDTVWEDILGYTMGRKLDVNIGHIDYNYDRGTLDFDNQADTTNNQHALTILYQLKHKVYRGAGAVMRPHLHFYDDDILNKPAWKVEYKILGRGDYAGVDWTALDSVNFVHQINNTVNGMEEIVSLGDIPITDVPLSAQIVLRVWRDGANDSAPTNVSLAFADAHVPTYKLGSKDEFIE